MVSKNTLAFLVLLTVFCQLTPALAQSGRKRPANEPRPQPPPEKKAPAPPAGSTKPATTTGPATPAPPSGPKRVLVPAGAAIASEEHSGVTSRYVFKNGITVIVREDHSVPLAASAVYVKAGTANDPEGQSGVARVVEKMIAQARGGASGELLQQVRKLGGVSSSKADFDATSYYLLGASNNFLKLLELQFKSLQRESLSSDEVARAAKLVAQADRLKLDDPLGYGQQRILRAAFESVGNSAEETKLVTKEQAQAFYDRYYRANNIIVVVVGDVLADNARLAAQQFLGAMKPGEAAAKVAATAAEGPPPVRYLAERADINQTVVSVGYRVPGLKEKESAAFEVLRALLTFGRGAILPQALIEPAFATQVSADYIASNKGGLFAFQMQVVPERFVKAEEKLFEQIENIRRLIISPGELQRAKSLLEKQYYDRTMSAVELAGQLAFWEARGGYKNFDNYLQRIKGVTGEQIQQLAAQYFNFKNAVVHEYEPRNAGPRIPGSDPIYTPERFEAYINVLVPRTHKGDVGKDEIVYAPEIPPARQGKERREQTTTEGGFILELQPTPVRDFSTLRGPRAYVREDQSRPLLAVGIYFQGGRLIENTTNSGITELMLRTMLRGTQRQSGADLALVLEQLGAEIKIVNEPDYFGYTLEVLSRNSEPAMKLLIDIIENAAFDKEEFAREKASLLAAVRATSDDGERRPIELLHNALYGTHPYGLPQLGLESTINQMTETEVVNWYQKLVKRQLPLVVIVGDTEGSSLVGRFVADGFSRRDLDRTLSVPTLAASTTASDKIEKRERRQTALALGFNGPEGKSPDNFVLEVIRQIVDGPGGRFLANLQQQDLNFDLEIRTEPRLLRSNFLVYMNTPPDQEERARTLIEEEFRRLGGAPIPDDELEAGRNSAIAAALDQMRAHGRRAEAYARFVYFGMQAADVDNLQEKLQAVTKDDVRRALQSYFVNSKRGIGVLRATTTTETQR